MSKENAQVLHLQVNEGLAVAVIPDTKHEFLIPTKEVAKGYGISDSRIRHHIKEHPKELIEGKHFISGVRIPHTGSNGSSVGTLWTKRGVVRLGFFIKSLNAMIFRDWAEELILGFTNKDQQEFTKIVERAAFVAGSNNKLSKLIGVSNGAVSQLKRPDFWGSYTLEFKEKIKQSCLAVISGKHKTKGIELSKDNTIGLLADITKIEDSQLRASMVNKLLGRVS